MLLIPYYIVEVLFPIKVMHACNESENVEHVIPLCTTLYIPELLYRDSGIDIEEIKKIMRYANAKIYYKICGVDYRTIALYFYPNEIVQKLHGMEVKFGNPYVVINAA